MASPLLRPIFMGLRATPCMSAESIDLEHRIMSSMNSEKTFAAVK